MKVPPDSNCTPECTCLINYRREIFGISPIGERLVRELAGTLRSVSGYPKSKESQRELEARRVGAAGAAAAPPRAPQMMPPLCWRGGDVIPRACASFPRAPPRGACGARPGLRRPCLQVGAPLCPRSTRRGREDHKKSVAVAVRLVCRWPAAVTSARLFRRSPRGAATPVGSVGAELLSNPH